MTGAKKKKNRPKRGGALCTFPAQCGALSHFITGPLISARSGSRTGAFRVSGGPLSIQRVQVNSAAECRRTFQVASAAIYDTDGGWLPLVGSFGYVLAVFLHAQGISQKDRSKKPRTFFGREGRPRSRVRSKGFTGFPNAAGRATRRRKFRPNRPRSK